ncbi:MAG: DUF4430 domain-containing protein [Clostridia bacterium]|nr:DUF4430 domain-containing protein [Clostridia bacterium]
MIMKRILTTALSVILTVSMLLSLAACAGDASSGGLWDSATYVEDTVLGTGAKTITVEVVAEDKTVTFTVNTDKETVGEALLEHALIAGDTSEYGLYVKQVNGITADYDVDKSYWAFYINGEYAMSGVDATDIDTEAKYQLAYTK